MATSRSTLYTRVQRAGCWAAGLYAFGIFFTFGAIISLLNADLLRTLGGLILAALSVACGIWLARRHGRASA